MQLPFQSHTQNSVRVSGHETTASVGKCCHVYVSVNVLHTPSTIDSAKEKATDDILSTCTQTLAVFFNCMQMLSNY